MSQTPGGLVDATGETWIIVGKRIFYCPPIADERSECVEARMVPLPAEAARAQRAAPAE